MKLVEALRIAGGPEPDSAAPLNVLLATGFTALHLQTFLAANLRMVFPNHRLNIRTGHYGDLVGTLEGLEEGALDAVVVAIEWPDLDPRLGFRNLGGWGPSDLEDIVNSLRTRARRIEDAIRNISGRVPVAVCLPTLPLPPASFVPGWQASIFDLQIRECISSLACKLFRYEGTRIVNPQRLDNLSSPADRLNLRSELLYGFPYRLQHAAVMAEQLALLVESRPPKKGLITDLDETLWSGIVGEAGAQGVFWDLDHHSQMHGVFQLLLRSLAESGVLIAVASKNNPAIVADTFRREDLLLPEKYIFPVEVHWRAKSESVAHILETWNIGAGSVVFVDDNAMELDEVRNAFPELECIQFPRGDDQAIYHLLETLRDLFGKPRISEEDRIRLQSIRHGRSVHDKISATDGDSRRFLEQIDGEITLDFAKDPPDPRALELLNKTNQFNLNGNRYTQNSWVSYLQGSGNFLLVVSYKDRYGPLGKIAVITGHPVGDTLFVDNWVMSCRAFARQIEYLCLDQLFERFEVDRVSLNFSATARNGPLKDFFSKMLGEAPQGTFQLSRQAFRKTCPRLLHRVKECGIEPMRVV